MLAMLSKWLTEAPQNVKEIEIVLPVVGHPHIHIHILKKVRKYEVINSRKNTWKLF